MKYALALATCSILLWCGCRSDSGKPADGKAAGGKAFLDEKKDIPPRLEWNREIKSRSGGAFSFRITSQGPFSVVLVTERGYKAVMTKKGFDKADVLLMTESREPTYEGKATVPAGSSWFIIQNLHSNNVKFHLQCFE